MWFCSEWFEGKCSAFMVHPETCELKKSHLFLLINGKKRQVSR